MADIGVCTKKSPYQAMPRPLPICKKRITFELDFKVRTVYFIPMCQIIMGLKDSDVHCDIILE
jgi:hypothetical protein